MSKLHIFLLIDPSLRFLLKKLANTKYVDAWELWTQCKEPGYIYIQKENYTEYILSKPTEIIFSEIFRRCLQGNKSKELTLSRPSSLFIHRTRKTGSMHAPATCMTNALQPRHARISMLVLWQLGSTNIQILYLVIAGSLWSLPLAVYTFSGFTIICFLAAELLALLHEDKGI